MERIFGFLVVMLVCVAGAGAETLPVLRGAGVQFEGDARWRLPAGAVRQDNGRVIEKRVKLPVIEPGDRVVVKLAVNAVEDRWDRAGSVRLEGAAGEVELLKFITGFGGDTRHERDVTSLSPMMSGQTVTVCVFIDTWVEKAWSVDVSLAVVRGAGAAGVAWARPIVEPTDWDAQTFAGGRQRIRVSVPQDAGRVRLAYFASGHAMDGRGGDEFVTRTHRIYVDGKKVYEARPWRTDGRRFRGVNPESGRWNVDGKEVWSSDLDRSGWMPGDAVAPMVVDLSRYLTPGEHTVEYEIVGIRPQDEKGKGYWRVSSYVWGER